MKRKGLIALALAFGLFYLAISGTIAAERVKLASAIKLTPAFYLTALAGAQQNIWKRLGLEMEWIAFSAATIHYHAFSANQVDLGMGRILADWPSASRGVPFVIVSNLTSRSPATFIWVGAGSRFARPEDIAGIKLGVSSLIGPEYVHGKVIARGLKKEEVVKFVATGGISQSLAALKVGAVDGVVLTLPLMVGLKIKGEVREYMSADDYLPKPWADYVVTAHKNLLATRPEVVRRSIKAILETGDFINKNPAWAQEKMKEMQGLPPQAAELVLKELVFATDARIERQALDNVRNFLIDYKLVGPDAPLPVDKIYDARFIP